MPIEFQCPKCETMVRVGDEAAGKKGRCPQCQAELRVPHVAPPPPAAPLPPPAHLAAPGKIEFQCPQCQAVIGVPESAAGLTGNCPQCGITLQVPAPRPRPLPVAASPFSQPSYAAAPAGFPQEPYAVDSSESVSSVDTSVAAQLRKRQQKNSSGTILKVVGALVVAGLLGVGWYFLRPAGAAKLAGQLTAEQLPKFETPLVEVDPELITLKRNKLSVLREFLRDGQLKLRSSLMTMSFAPTENSFQVRVAAGDETQFIRVDPHQDETLAKYLKKTAEKMDAPRKKELRDAIPVFYEAIEIYRKKDGASTADLADYRGSVGIPTLVQGFGYHVDAAYRGEVHRCVYEDPEGRLYFLLPAAAKSFELRGRDIPNDPAHFNGVYKVAIERSGSKDEVEAEPSDEPRTRKPTRKKKRSDASEESADESKVMQTAEESGEMSDEDEMPASKKKKGTSGKKAKSEQMLTEDAATDEEMSESMGRKPVGSARKKKTEAMMSEDEATDEEMAKPAPKKKKKPQMQPDE